MRRSGYRTPHRRQRISSADWLRLRGLSPREAEATLLFAHGLLTREVAERMPVTEGTAKTHLARAREKLGVDTSREVTALLLHEGVVKPEDFLAPRVPATRFRGAGGQLRQQVGDKRSTNGSQEIYHRLTDDGLPFRYPYGRGISPLATDGQGVSS